VCGHVERDGSFFQICIRVNLELEIGRIVLTYCKDILCASIVAAPSGRLSLVYNGVGKDTDVFPSPQTLFTVL